MAIIDNINLAMRGFASATIDVPANSTLKIETSPKGVDVATLTTPAGKIYRFGITVSLEVLDAE